MPSMPAIPKFIPDVPEIPALVATGVLLVVLGLGLATESAGLGLFLLVIGGLIGQVGLIAYAVSLGIRDARRP